MTSDHDSDVPVPGGQRQSDPECLAPTARAGPGEPPCDAVVHAARVPGMGVGVGLGWGWGGQHWHVCPSRPRSSRCSAGAPPPTWIKIPPACFTGDAPFETRSEVDSERTWASALHCQWVGLAPRTPAPVRRGVPAWLHGANLPARLSLLPRGGLRAAGVGAARHRRRAARRRLARRALLSLAHGRVEVCRLCEGLLAIGQAASGCRAAPVGLTRRGPPRVQAREAGLTRLAQIGDVNVSSSCPAGSHQRRPRRAATASESGVRTSGRRRL